jgi:DNA-binding HxlR family transcriptional regulator
MTAIKVASTNQVNKRENDTKCPVTFTLNKIGGRWKPLIINRLLGGPLRYGELKRAIPAITEKMLIQHLKELEADQLITRVAHPVIPPHVDYSLTQVGRDLSPILVAMKDWAAKYNVGDSSSESEAG